MMDHKTEHDRTLELMPEYALENLSIEERLLVERHISHCPPCADELDQFRVAAESLPAGIVLYEPPLYLKERVLSRAYQHHALRDSLESVTAAPDHLPPASEGLRTQPAPAAAWGRRRSLSPAWGIAAATLALILALTSGLLWARLNRLQSTSRLRTVAMTAAEGAPGATGTLVISLDGEHGTLVVDALPVLDEAQEYQLWLIKNGDRVSGGIFSVSKEGYGAVWVHAPDALASYQSAVVTIEPAGGSHAPTGEKVLFADL